MARGNGGGMAIQVTPEMLGRMFGGSDEKPETQEERVARVTTAFNKIVDEITAAKCRTDETPEMQGHRKQTLGFEEFLRHTHHFEVLPEPVADALIQALTYEALHLGGEEQDQFMARVTSSDRGTSIVPSILLMAGVVLKTLEKASSAGTKIGTFGNYL